MNSSAKIFVREATFLGGISAIIYCPGRIVGKNAFEADANQKAITSDWREIGKDMYEAIRAYERST